MPKDTSIELPGRHLGLVQAQELDDLETRLDSAARAIADTDLAELPAAIDFATTPNVSPPPLLTGMRIGVARDAAFAFLYPANLELLSAMGAELRFFSPLSDSTLPEVDSLYLPGGYPELHLEQLAANSALHRDLHRHHQTGKPIYAECGGMLYLLECLTDQQNRSANLVGLLPGHAVMQAKLTSLGMQSAILKEGELRGHTFHYSRLQTPLHPWLRGKPQRGSGRGEAIYRTGRLTASYLHLYFPSHPRAAAELFLP